MTDINRVAVIGRLTRDLGTDEREFGYLPNGTARANISIAVNSSKKQGDQYIDEVSYFDVTLWGKSAENLHPYLRKGKQIAVEGHLKQDRWKDQQGNNRSRIYIVADNVQLLGGKSEGGENSTGAGNSGYQPQNQQTFTPKANSQSHSSQQAEFNGNMDEFPEDIPF